jgi:hypothetical protein
MCGYVSFVKEVIAEKMVPDLRFQLICWRFRITGCNENWIVQLRAVAELQPPLYGPTICA